MRSKEGYLSQNLTTGAGIFTLAYGASYLRCTEELTISKEPLFGILIPHKRYTKIGSKKRSSFSWSEPIEYLGTYLDGTTKYALFGHDTVTVSGDRIYHWYYAFPCTNHCLLHYSSTFQSCRDIIVDSVEEEV